jgi:hypothetical protein
MFGVLAEEVDGAEVVAGEGGGKEDEGDEEAGVSHIGVFGGGREMADDSDAIRLGARVGWTDVYVLRVDGMRGYIPG